MFENTFYMMVQQRGGVWQYLRFLSKKRNAFVLGLLVSTEDKTIITAFSGDHFQRWIWCPGPQDQHWAVRFFVIVATLSTVPSCDTH